MADNETPTNAALLMDRGIPIGNSSGDDGRRALHTKIKNNPDEPIYVAVSGVEMVIGSVTAYQGGQWDITNITGNIVLPNGASTSALQNTGNSSLGSIDTKLSGILSVSGTVTANAGTGTFKVDGSAVTQPVSGSVAVNNFPATQNVAVVSSVELEVKNDSGSPLAVTGAVSASQSGVWNINDVSGTISLPTGAASSALQSAGNLTLSSIQTNQTNGTQQTKLTDGSNIVTVKALNNQVSGSDFGLVVNSVIHGLTTAGGGGYVDVKVNPSGTLTVDASGTTVPISNASLSSIDAKLVDNFGAASGALRTAAQLGNPNGSADFNAGTTSAQTIRTSANITRNGTELSYNAGSSDANTQRVAANTYDGSGNAITSTITAGTKRSLDISVVDGPQLDSYNRLRVANQDLIFGVQFANTVNSLLFNTSIVGSATLTSVTNQAAARLTTTTGATDSVIVQSKRYLRYNPGVSHQIMITGIIGAKKTNVRQRWGYFDTSDGLFFEQTSTDLAVVTRTSTSGSIVDNRVLQANWNLDKLDGTGTSGITLDTSKHNVYVIDFVWQGAGRTRFGIMSGQGVIYFHQIINANVNTSPYMRSPSRPGRAELTNLGVTANTTVMDIVCVFALRETSDKLLAPFAASASRGSSSVNVSTIKPLITLRPKATFNGITNRIPIVPVNTTIITNNQNILVQVYINATLTGASFTSAGTNSAAEFDVSSTAISGGTLILETYIPSSQSGALDLTALADNAILGLDIAGSVQDSISITATSLAGGTTTWAAIGWQEFQ